MTTTTTSRSPVAHRGGPPPVRPPARPARPTSAGGPPVDPRIAARRVAVRRDAGRRRLRRLAGVGVGLALVAGAAALTRSAALDVDHIRVQGVERVPAEEVVALVTAAGAGRGQPLVDVEVDAAERAVAELPAVAEVVVSRRWPGTVVIDVVERAPVAVVASDQGSALVAADGVVIDVVASPPDLPVLEGTAAVDGPGAVLAAEEQLTVAAALPEALRPEVEAVVATGPGEVALRLADGAVARLGPAVDLPAKLGAAATMLEHVDRACLQVLDVRVPVAPAVTRDPGCTG